jgi:hypothetical protein
MLNMVFSLALPVDKKPRFPCPSAMREGSERSIAEISAHDWSKPYNNISKYSS